MKGISTRHFAHVLVIVFLALLIYSNTFDAPFQFDDEDMIVRNPVIKDLRYFLEASKVREIGNSFQAKEFYNRYMTVLSLALNYEVHGLEVFGYHAVNITIHIFNAILFYFLLILTFKTPFFTPGENYLLFPLRHSRFFALASALLFVSHPIQTGAVTYIWQRATSLAAFFYLLSLVLYVKGRQSAVCMEHVANPDSQKIKYTMRFAPGPMLYYLFSLISAVLAMKTKQIAFTLPALIALYEFLFFEGGIKKRFLYVAPFLITLLIIPLGVLIDKSSGDLIGNIGQAARDQSYISRSQYFLTELRVIVTYLRLLFFPFNQNLDYDYRQYNSLFDPPVLFSSIILFSLIGTAVYLLYRSRIQGPKFEVQRLRDVGQKTGQSSKLKHSLEDHSLFANHYLRLIGFGIFWFFMTLSVESSFIPIADLIFEHRVYLPSAGFFLAFSSILAIIARKLEGRKVSARPVFFVTIMIVSFLSIAAYARNSLWKDSVALWENAVKGSPQKARPHINAAKALLDEGRIDEAIEHYRMALDLEPSNPIARCALGAAYARKEMYDEAIEQYQTALRVAADSRVYNNMGMAYAMKGLAEKSIECYREAVRLEPGYALAHYNLGLAYSKKGLFDEAIDQYEKALTMNLDNADIRDSLGLAFFSKGWLDKAAEQYRIALQLDPAHAYAHYDLARVYEKQGSMENAIEHFGAALNLGPDNEDFRESLSKAYKYRKLTKQR